MCPCLAAHLHEKDVERRGVLFRRRASTLIFANLNSAFPANALSRRAKRTFLHMRPRAVSRHLQSQHRLEEVRTQSIVFVCVVGLVFFRVIAVAVSVVVVSVTVTTLGFAAVHLVDDETEDAVVGFLEFVKGKFNFLPWNTAVLGDENALVDIVGKEEGIRENADGRCVDDNHVEMRGGGLDNASEAASFDYRRWVSIGAARTEEKNFGILSLTDIESRMLESIAF